jgi:uncharacterized protein YjiS (DUF1127 family)
MPAELKTVAVFLDDVRQACSTGGPLWPRRIRQALTRFIAARRKDLARPHRYQSVSELDPRMLEEIGLTREQAHYDASEPVWWR